MWCRAHSLALSWRLGDMIEGVKMSGYAQARLGR